MSEELLPEKRLDLNTSDILSDLIEEPDAAKIKDLTQLFNLNLFKKNAVRVQKYNELLDSISDQIQQRLQKRGDEFSNGDLITYLKIVQDSLEKSSKTLNQVDETPVINFNQTNNSVNIGVEEQTLNRESRERVLDFINNYLEKVQQEAAKEKAIVHLDEDQFTEEVGETES